MTEDCELKVIAARAFDAAMRAGSERLKREIGYNATRFDQMVDEHTGVGAAQHLLRGRVGSSDGFTKLWEHGRLSLSVEAHVLLPWYRDLFTEDERERARTLLEEHHFDVDAFLAEAERDPPRWWREAAEG